MYEYSKIDFVNFLLYFRTFGGEIGSVHIGDASEFNPVSEASTECYDTAAVGQTASTWSWRGYQNILTR